jgi:hypothetical protein
MKQNICNKEVVLEAVRENGRSLEYASKELRNNKEVVLEAVKQDGNSLYYASEELRNNKEVVLEAVRENGNSLLYASKKLLQLVDHNNTAESLTILIEKEYLLKNSVKLIPTRKAVLL